MYDIDILVKHAENAKNPTYQLLYSEMILDRSIIQYALNKGLVEDQYECVAKEIIEERLANSKVEDDYDRIAHLIDKGLRHRNLVNAFPDSEFKENYLIEIDQIRDNSQALTVEAIEFLQKINDDYYD